MTLVRDQVSCPRSYASPLPDSLGESPEADVGFSLGYYRIRNGNASGHLRSFSNSSQVENSVQDLKGRRPPFESDVACDASILVGR